MAEVLPPRPIAMSRVDSVTFRPVSSTRKPAEANTAQRYISKDSPLLVRSPSQDARRIGNLSSTKLNAMRQDGLSEVNGEMVALDPISQQIFERTHTPFKATSSLPTTNAANTIIGGADEQLTRQMSASDSVKKTDSLHSTKLSKEKKKGVSFLSRIIGTRKKDGPDSKAEVASQISENRSTWDAETLMSQPVGFIPKFPAPLKYCKVKTQHRRQKDFDRLFLAQTLLHEPTQKEKDADVDAKIQKIDDNDTSSRSERSSVAHKAIWAMDFSKDGKYLAAGGQDKKLRIWQVIGPGEDKDNEEVISDDTSNDADEPKLRAPVFKPKLVREYEGHTSAILDLSWSKNNFVLSSSMDKTVRLYHVSRAECLCSFKHNDFVTSIQFHPRDDRFFLAGSLDAKVRLWSIPDKTVAYWTQAPDMVTAVAFTPDGKTSIAGTLNGICILYETEGLKAHSQIQVRSNRGKNAKGSKITGIDTIAMPRAVGQPEVKMLITSNDSRIRMYNLRDRNLEVKFRGNDNSTSQIRATFSDDGRYVICGSEDHKVYMWPTHPAERPEGEKRPMEVFEASHAIVTTALLAPAASRRLLGQSGDPIYDLCNPPPITLLSRTDSVISSKAATTEVSHADGKTSDDSPSRRQSFRKAPETPAYLARHSHLGGHIIVTADYLGEIKVYRQDCAFQKRRHESWDNSSNFSKKVLGRTGSNNTRNSRTGSLHRTSLSLGNGPQSTDRILSWRNSISNGQGNSAANSVAELPPRAATMGNNSPRNSSPKRAHRRSLRHLNDQPTISSRSTPASAEVSTHNLHKEELWHKKSDSPQHTSKTAESVHGPQKKSDSPQRLRNMRLSMPRISVQSPDTPDDSEAFHSADDKPGAQDKAVDAPAAKRRDPTTNYNPDFDYNVRQLNANPDGLDLPHKPGDPLFLIGEQSFAGWNLENTLGPMANHAPRTPGTTTNPAGWLSRSASEISAMSQLSSEIQSSLSGGRLSPGRQMSAEEPELDRSRTRSSECLSSPSVTRTRSRSEEHHPQFRKLSASSANAAQAATKAIRKLTSRKPEVTTPASAQRVSLASSSEEVRCSHCRNTSFKASVTKKGQHVLTCTRCGTNLS